MSGFSNKRNPLRDPERFLLAYIRNWEELSWAQTLDCLNECFSTRYRVYFSEKLANMIQHMRNKTPYDLPGEDILPPRAYNKKDLLILANAVATKTFLMKSSKSCKDILIMVNDREIFFYKDENSARLNLDWLEAHLGDHNSSFWHQKQRNLCLELFLQYETSLDTKHPHREGRKYSDWEIADLMTEQLCLKTEAWAVADFLMSCAFDFWRRVKYNFMKYYDSAHFLEETGTLAEPGTSAMLGYLQRLDPTDDADYRIDPKYYFLPPNYESFTPEAETAQTFSSTSGTKWSDSTDDNNYQTNPEYYYVPPNYEFFTHEIETAQALSLTSGTKWSDSTDDDAYRINPEYYYVPRDYESFTPETETAQASSSTRRTKRSGRTDDRPRPPLVDTTPTYHVISPRRTPSTPRTKTFRGASDQPCRSGYATTTTTTYIISPRHYPSTSSRRQTSGRTEKPSKSRR
ncbi:MAG: hypothetical protein MMC33_002744 [Icmadophila ericetorum]|nr:hypothetical protein [Icmadophila ericetorum]